MAKVELRVVSQFVHTKEQEEESNWRRCCFVSSCVHASYGVFHTTTKCFSRWNSLFTLSGRVLFTPLSLLPFFFKRFIFLFLPLFGQDSEGVFLFDRMRWVSCYDYGITPLLWQPNCLKGPEEDQQVLPFLPTLQQDQLALASLCHPDHEWAKRNNWMNDSFIT